MTWNRPRLGGFSFSEEMHPIFVVAPEKKPEVKKKILKSFKKYVNKNQGLTF